MCVRTLRSNPRNLQFLAQRPVAKYCRLTFRSTFLSKFSSKASSCVFRDTFLKWNVLRDKIFRRGCYFATFIFYCLSGVHFIFCLLCLCIEIRAESLSKILSPINFCLGFQPTCCPSTCTLILSLSLIS